MLTRKSTNFLGTGMAYRTKSLYGCYVLLAFPATYPRTISIVFLTFSSLGAQDLFLSLRVIHFTKDEIVQACIKNYTCECKKPTRFSNLQFEKKKWQPDASSLFRAQGLISTEAILRQAEITYDHDRLPTISSLGSVFENGGDMYLAGLQKQDFPICLLWKASDSYHSCMSTDPPS